MISNNKAKKLNNKLNGASTHIQGFGGATTKQLKHYVIPTFADDTLDVEKIHKNKEVLSTDGIVNAILDIDKWCQSHGVNSILISNLICRKNDFQSNKIVAIYKLLKSACD